jgi:signal peptide peptidase SppA
MLPLHHVPIGHGPDAGDTSLACGFFPLGGGARCYDCRVKSVLLALLALAFAAALLAGGIFVLGQVAARPEPSCDVATVRLYGELYSFVAKDDDVTRPDEPTYYRDDVPSDADSLRSFVSSSDEVVRAIEAAAANPAVRGVIVEIDSPGGSPYAGDAIRGALERLGKPSVAVIKEVGASAAYWAASGADWIVASAVSDVGSIGVTGSFVEYDYYNKQNGYTFVELASAPYKEAGNPDKPITQADYDYLQAAVDELHGMFVDAVAESRGIPRAEVAEIADGRSMYGRAALQAGLIDEVGGLREAYAYLGRALGGPIEVCEAGE